MQAGVGQAVAARIEAACWLTRIVQVAVAGSVGWLPDAVSDEMVQILKTVRTMAAHPGAFVRGVRQIPDSDFDLADPAGFEAVYVLVYAPASTSRRGALPAAQCP